LVVAVSFVCDDNVIMCASDGFSRSLEVGQVAPDGDRVGLELADPAPALVEDEAAGLDAAAAAGMRPMSRTGFVAIASWRVAWP
jgi:hypothetical protein